MKRHLIRIAALAAVLAAAGCVSSNEVEVVQTSAATTEPVSAYAEMHAAIPADKGNNKFFDYN